MEGTEIIPADQRLFEFSLFRFECVLFSQVSWSLSINVHRSSLSRQQFGWERVSLLFSDWSFWFDVLHSLNVIICISSQWFIVMCSNPVLLRSNCRLPAGWPYFWSSSVYFSKYSPMPLVVTDISNLPITIVIYLTGRTPCKFSLAIPATLQTAWDQ